MPDLTVNELSHEELIVQAKALVMCGLPYKPVPEKEVMREAQLGPGVTLRVTYAAIGEGAELPYGTDRSILAWIQTKAYPDGIAMWNSVLEYMDAFGLYNSGYYYEEFHRSIDRLKRLAIQIEIEKEDGTITINGAPIRASYTPRNSVEAKSLAGEEASGQVHLFDDRRYGFVLDKPFMKYFSENFVKLPIELMRRFHGRPKAWDFCQAVYLRCLAARSTSVWPMIPMLKQLGATDRQIHEVSKYVVKQKSYYNGVLEEMREHLPGFPAEFERGRKGLRVSPFTLD